MVSLIPVKTPSLLKLLYPKYLWHIATTEKVIYLTFDDGPTPEITTWVLQQLERYNAKATFFCIGNNVEKHPDIFAEVLKKGHAIGNHTQHHLKGWRTSKSKYINDVTKAQQTINQQYDKAIPINAEKSLARLFRPPYGKVTSRQARALQGMGYRIVMWDVLSFDWEAKVSKEACCNNVISNTTSGSMVVFHDSVKASRNMQYALPRVLEHFHDKGYKFKSLSNYM